VKYIKKFNESTESIDHDDQWENVISTYDVGQLLELIKSAYGPIMVDSNQDFTDYDEDYNPEHLYDTIRWELEKLNKFNDFVENYNNYVIQMEENDPFHWRHRAKQFKNLTDSWGDLKFESSGKDILETIGYILLDLNDEGFKTHVTPAKDWDKKYKGDSDIRIRIKKEGGYRFKISDVDSTIKRLSSYMESEGYKIILDYESMELNKNLVDLFIYYKKSPLTMIKAKSKFKPI
jgi:hypothetical protein